jgi:predicted tellurium resistance membrane protein TerC
VPVSGFVNRHPTVKMVALSFFLLIGMTLVTTGAGFHVPTGHNDAAMGLLCHSRADAQRNFGPR